MLRSWFALKSNNVTNGPNYLPQLWRAEKYCSTSLVYIFQTIMFYKLPAWTLYVFFVQFLALICFLDFRDERRSRLDAEVSVPVPEDQRELQFVPEWRETVARTARNGNTAKHSTTNRNAHRCKSFFIPPPIVTESLNPSSITVTSFMDEIKKMFIRIKAVCCNLINQECLSKKNIFFNPLKNSWGYEV